MEDKKQRVLAYCMAKTIKPNQLSTISKGVHYTHGNTMSPSMTNERSIEFRDDSSKDA